jgi:hypothetical protein
MSPVDVRCLAAQFSASFSVNVSRASAIRAETTQHVGVQGRLIVTGIVIVERKAARRRNTKLAAYPITLLS